MKIQDGNGWETWMESREEVDKVKKAEETKTGVGKLKKLTLVQIKE